MEYEYKNKSDEELVREASTNDSSDMDGYGTGSGFVFLGAKEGRGATAELIRRLKNSINFSSWAMIILTIILVIFTAVLVWQGLKW